MMPLRGKNVCRNNDFLNYLFSQKVHTAFVELTLLVPRMVRGLPSTIQGQGAFSSVPVPVDEVDYDDLEESKPMSGGRRKS